ncbi:hypothetical protein Golax_005342 [Gossypium laxum]|uniref:Uncharacterized protein n=1 Tax=Gossypium laxum TaxID=34288 RepID=A0A7J9A1T0_9ROSI|nr:hypothetical protein [Gossypium laxum]
MGSLMASCSFSTWFVGKLTSELLQPIQENCIAEYLKQLQSYAFIQEHGLDPLMRNCKGE